MIQYQEFLNGIKGYGVPSVIQLHGKETIQRCKELKRTFPTIKFWKAVRIQSQGDLLLAKKYESAVDAILIDAWNQNSLGGTGERIPIEWLKKKDFAIPWWLAGGISSEWIESALKEINPYGVDLSSGVEKELGIKDNRIINNFIEKLNHA